VRKVLMLTVVLVVSAAWAHAQDAGKASGKTSDLTTMEGCLQSSNGQYTLIDDSNTSHILTGSASKLGHQVGHQVELSGKPGTRTVDSTLAGAGSSAVVQPVFEVKSVKVTAATCKSAGN
jgi:hypothetical protein